MNETVLTAVGNLATEVDRKVTSSNVAVATFRIACNERRWDRVTEKYVDGDTFYVRVTCWRNLADHVARVFQKGDAVIVRGRMISRNYQHESGTRYVTELEANAVGADVARAAVAIARRPKSDAFGEAGAQVPVAVPAAGETDDPWQRASSDGPAEASNGVDGSADDPFAATTVPPFAVGAAEAPGELVDAVPGAGR